MNSTTLVRPVSDLLIAPITRAEAHKPWETLPNGPGRSVAARRRRAQLDALAPNGYAGGPERTLDQRRRLWASGIGLPTAPRGAAPTVKCSCGERYAPDGDVEHAGPHKRHLGRS